MGKVATPEPATARQPASNQTSEPAKAATSTAAASSKPSNENSAPARTPLPTLRRSASFSVKDAMAGKVTTSPAPTASPNSSSSDSSDLVEETEDIMENILDEVDLNQKNLEQVWGKFASYVKVSRPRIGFALMANKPNLIDDSLITFDVVNQQQKDEIMTIYNELIVFIRKSLGSPLIELELNLAEVDTTSAKPYTVDEKFKHMIVKNPAVLTLKQALGLDFE